MPAGPMILNDSSCPSGHNHSDFLKNDRPVSFKRMLGSTPRVPHREAWQPAPDACLVVPVLLPEQPRQGGLFIQEDKRVGCEQEQPEVAEERQRSVEDRCSGQCKARPDVHGITNIAIRPNDDELTRRIKRGGRALTDNREREDAPECQRATGHADDNPCDLREAERGGRDDARRLEYAPREEDQEQADE